MVVVDAVLYVGSGVISSPMAKGQNSGEGERDDIFRRFVGV
jgi:hypothetical protein